jgi:hypothetical protein
MSFKGRPKFEMSFKGRDLSFFLLFTRILLIKICFLAQFFMTIDNIFKKIYF